MKTYLLILALTTLYAFSDTSVPALSDMMPIEVQKKTGVIRLKQHERKELAKWLHEKCFSSSSKGEASEKYLKVSLNINGGQKLQLTDNSVWDIKPSDVKISSTWLSDITVKIYPSGDEEFPYLIVNTTTKRSVKAKKGSSV